MKKTTKLVALFTSALFIIGGFSSCGKLSPEEALKKSSASMENVKSTTYDMNMVMSLSSGEDKISMNFDMDIDQVYDPYGMKVVTTMDLGELGNVKTDVYLVKDDETFITYTGMDYGTGETFWIKNTSEDMTDFEQYDAQASLDLYIDCVNQFTEAGKEDIGSRKTIRYDGEITSDMIEKVFKKTGMESLYSTIGLDVDETMDFEEMKSLKLSIWIDEKTYIPVKYYLDMTDMMQSIVDKIIASEIETAGESYTEEIPSIKADEVYISMVVTSIDSLDSIVIPDDVIDSAIEY